MKPVLSLVSTQPSEGPLTLERVYDAHFDFVYHAAARLGGPAVDPEDVAQDVFMVVGRKLDTFDHSCRITTWLYGITLNVARAARRRQRLRSLFEGKIDPPQVRSVDRAELAEAHRIAYEILDALAPKKREVFILAEFEGMTCEEIAEIVGSRTETIWSRLHYARREFSERLAARVARKERAR
jgi:RNA polymerase sigma-70 factor (ECF subfamily)